MTKTTKYGSDVIIDILASYEIDYVACNPGSSFRGLHDSVINYKKTLNQHLFCVVMKKFL